MLSPVRAQGAYGRSPATKHAWDPKAIEISHSQAHSKPAATRGRQRLGLAGAPHTAAQGQDWTRPLSPCHPPQRHRTLVISEHMVSGGKGLPDPRTRTHTPPFPASARGPALAQPPQQACRADMGPHVRPVTQEGPADTAPAHRCHCSWTVGACPVPVKGMGPLSVRTGPRLAKVIRVRGPWKQPSGPWASPSTIRPQLP